MKTPKGYNKLKKLVNIPVFIEGNPKPICVYEMPELEKALDLMKEMVSILSIASAELDKDKSVSLRLIYIQSLMSSVLHDYENWK